MTTSFPRFIARAALFVAFTTLVILNVYGQGSSARYIPTEQEKADLRVTNIINKAETHFKNGKLELENSRREQARDQFDKAIDSILDSGLDVRSYPKLREYFVQLTERIYREEVPLQQVTPQPAQNLQVAMTSGQPQQETQPPSQIGFRDQKFEPSPLDELSKLVLTPEETNVTPEDVGEIEVAKSSVDFNFETHPLIQQFINYYQVRGRSTMESGLRRSGRFMKMARQIFREEGVPEDITWLGQVESAWRPIAVSSAAASGLWQFVPGTGRTYGLRQTAWVDERNSFEKATRASARYLKDLANHFNGDWNLAMAAYNTGQGNVDRAVSRAGSANFWKIYPYIAQETKNYVPNILATILIAKNPEKYGFRNIQREPSMAYDIVQVPNATSLQLIAQATDTSVPYLRELNPELRRETTPRGEAYQVRIPGGKAKQFVAILNRIPSNARESAAIVSVAPGEDLEAVARRTGVSLAQLQQMNGGADKAVGNKIVVPKNSNVQLTSIVRAKPVTESSAGGGVAMKVRARAGDTVAKIAERFNFAADVVARLNGVAADAELQSGQEIKLPSVSAAPSRRRGR
ncbi:MAG TPA: transglycosylase SLT domain-containing protein [Pyrinomonadaceae bacterium]|jgi:membrane-bound lytic murein transglycosylase D